MRLRLALAFLAAFLCSAAHADTMDMAFFINGSGIASSGTLTLNTTSDPTVSRIVGVRGVFSSTAGAFSGAITGLNSASYSAANPTSDGGFVFDNLFYSTGATATCFGVATTGAVLDNCGIDFLVGNTFEVNMYMQPGIGYVVSDARASSNSSYLDLNAPVTFSFAQTPEVSGVWFTLTGVCGLAAYGRSRRSLAAGQTVCAAPDPLS